MSAVDSDIKIVVVGGGTGSFTLLSVLKDRTSQLSAIVNMVDDGGSTGILRDELGVLPPGDVRQCLVALSDTPKIRELFNYRFEEGTFIGHPFGNILLTALEKMTGSFDDAVKTASEILRVNGKVIPATLDDVRLKMEWPGSNSIVLRGERIIDANYFKYDPRRALLSLTPLAKANPAALSAIRQADIVLIAPGDLYTSLGPLLVIDGISDALVKTSATCIYVANLVTKKGQTEGFTVADHASEIERFVGNKFLDYVLYNKQVPNDEIKRRYSREGAFTVLANKRELNTKSYVAVPGNFLGEMANNINYAFEVKRSLIRHDAAKVVDAIFDLYYKKQR